MLLSLYLLGLGLVFFLGLGMEVVPTIKIWNQNRPYRQKRRLARAHARRTVRAPMPQPEPVNVSASWVPVSHDDVLFFLDQSIRGEFQDSPRFNNTLNTSEPAGSLTTTVDGASRPRPVSGYVE